MEHFANLAIRSIFLENMALAFFLGMCSFLACSKKVETAIGLGAAVVFVQVLTVPLNNLLLHYLLAEGALAWVSPVAGDGQPQLPVVHPVHRHDRRGHADRRDGRRPLAPKLYTHARRLPAADRGELRDPGGSLFMQERDYSFAESVVFGVGSGLGLAIAIVAMAAIREKMTYSHVPDGLKGLGITFITAGLMSLAFMVFSGIQL